MSGRIGQKQFATQRRKIFKYCTLKNASDQYAKKRIKRIKERLKHFLMHPDLGVQTEFGGIRMTAMGHFNIFYKTSQHQIIVVAFWDNRQNSASLLKIIQTTA
ncbi:MAG TPA: plasmid stabilization protein [Cytophagales bacterium]|nr:plasmid stabilization protein [Cytophagales bacterium]